MSTEFENAVAELSTQGFREVVVRGAMRQATFFAVGARLAQVTGTNISYIQHGTPWASDALRIAVHHPKDRSFQSTPEPTSPWRSV